MKNKNTIVSIVIAIVVIVIATYIITKNNKKEEINENVNESAIQQGMGEGDAISEQDQDAYSKSVQEKADSKANVLTEIQNATVKEFTVEGSNFMFSPSTISVNKGDTVKIIFKNTQGFHDFVVDEFGAATKQIKDPSTETITFVANKTGTFEYYCSVGQHRSMGMKGTLTVK